MEPGFGLNFCSPQQTLQEQPELAFDDQLSFMDSFMDVHNQLTMGNVYDTSSTLATTTGHTEPQLLDASAVMTNTTHTQPPAGRSRRRSHHKTGTWPGVIPFSSVADATPQAMEEESTDMQQTSSCGSTTTTPDASTDSLVHTHGFPTPLRHSRSMFEFHNPTLLNTFLEPRSDSTDPSRTDEDAITEFIESTHADIGIPVNYSEFTFQPTTTPVTLDSDVSQPAPPSTPSNSGSHNIPMSPSYQKKTRTRVANACSNCKKSKTKCDNQRPCSRCCRLGKVHSCVDSVHKKRGRKRSGKLKCRTPRRSIKSRTPKATSSTPCSPKNSAKRHHVRASSLFVGAGRGASGDSQKSQVSPSIAKNSTMRPHPRRSHVRSQSQPEMFNFANFQIDSMQSADPGPSVFYQPSDEFATQFKTLPSSSSNSSVDVYGSLSVNSSLPADKTLEPTDISMTPKVAVSPSSVATAASVGGASPANVSPQDFDHNQLRQRLQQNLALQMQAAIKAKLSGQGPS